MEGVGGNAVQLHKGFFLVGIHSNKAEQPHQYMELQEKEAQKDSSIQEMSSEKTYS